MSFFVGVLRSFGKGFEVVKAANISKITTVCVSLHIKNVILTVGK